MNLCLHTVVIVLRSLLAAHFVLQQRQKLGEFPGNPTQHASALAHLRRRRILAPDVADTSAIVAPEQADGTREPQPCLQFFHWSKIAYTGFSPVELSCEQ